MTVDAILNRFRCADAETWKQVADRIGVSYRRLICWRHRGNISAGGKWQLMARARALGVPLSPEDFLADGTAALGSAQPPFVEAKRKQAA